MAPRILNFELEATDANGNSIILTEGMSLRIKRRQVDSEYPEITSVVTIQQIRREYDKTIYLNFGTFVFDDYRSGYLCGSIAIDTFKNIWKILEVTT